jgi:hypothetical protein
MIRRKMEIRDMKLKLMAELLDRQVTYRIMELTASIAMEMTSIAKFRFTKAPILPVGNSKPAEVQVQEARVFEQVMSTIDGKSNAEQRAAKMATALFIDNEYQTTLLASNTASLDLETKEATLKGYKLEWQVIQENMMNLRAAAALLEGITDVEVKVKKEKKPKKPTVEEVSDNMLAR